MAITFYHEKQVAAGKFDREGVCLSSDTKPTTDETMANGSRLIEMDSSTLYFYDEDNTEWRPFA